MNPRANSSVALTRIAVVVHDLVMVYVCWQLIHVLRYASRQEGYTWTEFSPTVALVLVAQGLVFWRVGLYRGLWRFASVPDLWNILKAGIFGLLAIVLGLAVYNRLESVPRTVLVVYPFALTVLLGMPRPLRRSLRPAWEPAGTVTSRLPAGVCTSTLAPSAASQGASSRGW